MKRFLFSIQLASAKDPVWWLQKDGIRYNLVLALVWERIPNNPVGVVALHLWPLMICLGFNWGPKPEWPFNVPPAEGPTEGRNP